MCAARLVGVHELVGQLSSHLEHLQAEAAAVAAAEAAAAKAANLEAIAEAELSLRPNSARSGASLYLTKSAR